MELKETAISSETVYDGKIIKVQKDRVRLPNGKEALREVVRHQGGVCVCAVDGDLNLFFVRQYRYPFQEAMLELPAGKLDVEGEDAYDGALRELREETGIIAADMMPLGEIYSSVGFCDESIQYRTGKTVPRRRRVYQCGKNTARAGSRNVSEGGA